MTIELAEELHHTVLKTAGWLPDDVLVEIRTALAAGADGPAARLIAFAGKRTVLPLADDDLDLLGEALDADDADPAVLDAVELAAEHAVLPWLFTVERAEPDVASDADELPPEGDLVGVVSAEQGARALWRAWRWPADDVAYPPPRPVYVVEVDVDQVGADFTGLAQLAGRLQALLTDEGQVLPQVEVVTVQTEAAEYQRRAMAEGGLLWAAEPNPEIVVARVFDAADAQHGPSFAPDHPKMTDDADRERTLRYLRAGTPFLMTISMLDDIVAPEKGAVVPMTFRTDGRWIWPDAVAYYLEEYHLAPEPGLLLDIQASDGPPGQPDTVALRRALQVLTQPRDDAQPLPAA